MSITDKTKNTGFPENTDNPLSQGIRQFIGSELSENLNIDSDAAKLVNDSLNRSFNLLEMVLDIQNQMDIASFLHRALHHFVTLLKADRAFLILENTSLPHKAEAFYKIDAFDIAEGSSFEYKKVLALVRENRTSLVTSDSDRDSRFTDFISGGRFPQHSFICGPLFEYGEIKGFVFLENHFRDRIFTGSDLELFNLLLNLITPALHNILEIERLKLRDNYNRTVQFEAPVGMMIVDYTGHIISINAAALEIFDLNRNEIRTEDDHGQPDNFIELLTEEQKPRWTRIFNIVITSQDNFIDSRYTHNTGYLEKILSLKIIPLRQIPEREGGLLVVVDDVTEQVAMEKYVILSEKLAARGEMTSRLSHRLNNFLSVIANNSELMTVNLEKENYEKAKFNAELVRDSIFKIKHFLENLVDLPRPLPEFISYNLNQLINDTLFAPRYQSRFRNIHFSMELDETLPNIEIDVAQIQQVLVNILTNAVETTEEKALALQADDSPFQRNILIKTEYNQSLAQVTIEITDNGCGMDNQTLSKIFNLHFTTKKNGHGLGLYNSQRIIKQHKGRITADSVLNESSTVTITLPRFQRRKTDL